mmetsp:Transcript_24687/g.66546  ORF Transcript_24687/g.66546 Transcript_24687/m.66546 type:complete len:285 (-) Transcript_24687:505-1359(-)
MAVQDPRGDGGRIVDEARVLNAYQKRQIHRLIDEAERQTRSEVLVVTLPSLDGVASPKTFATALFNQWQIGPSYPNNGVLVLVVPGARRIEVEIGSGLNRMFRVDNWLPGMLQRSVVPAMKSGDIGAGTSAAVEACARRLVETNTAVLLQARFRRTVLDPNVLYPLLSSAAMTLITRATLVADRNKQCHSCKARFAWGWDRSVLNGLKWNVTEPATDFKSGTKERAYRCRRCGHVGLMKASIPKYDGFRTKADGAVVYYRGSSGSSGPDSGGGSSSGGGGGASW